MSESPINQTPAPVDDLTLARAVRVTVESLPGVSRVSAGRFVQAATYGPGATVHGVVISRAAGTLDIEVHLVARYARTLVLPKLAEHIRRTVRRIVEPLAGQPAGRIDIMFDDLDVEAEDSLRPAVAAGGHDITRPAERIEAGL